MASTTVDVKEVAVSRSVRVNTGNYEGTEHFVSMKAEVGFDDPEAVREELNALVEEAMIAQLLHSYKVRKKAMTRAQVQKLHGLAGRGA